MTKHLLLIPLIGVTLTGCGGVKRTFQLMEENRQAIEMSTYAIQENIQAIDEANRSIDENRRQVEQVNQALRKAAAES